MTSGYAKLRLILWKNWKIALRKPVLTIVEILVPVAFSCLIILLRIVGSIKEEKEITKYTPFNPEQNASNEVLLRFEGKMSVAWAPKEGSTNTFKEACETMMKIVFEDNGVEVIRKDNPSELEDYLQTPGVTDMLKGDKVLCGIVYDGGGLDLGLCSRKLKVQIRFPGDLRKIYEFKPSSNWHSKHLLPVAINLAPRDPKENEGPIPSYYKEGFLTIQGGVSKGVIGYCATVKNPVLPPEFSSTVTLEEMLTAGALDPDIQMRRYSYPPYSEDPLLDRARFIVPFLVMLSFIYTCLAITKQVANEKETQMKEMMKIMGLPCSLHWIGWFIKCITFLLLSSALIVVVLKVEWVPRNAVFGRSDGTVIFIFYAYYMVALTCFCFMMSSFFTQSHVASVAAGMAWFLFYCPHFFMVSGSSVFTLSVKIPLALFLNVAMAFSMELFLISESTGEGITWQNICRPASYSEKITLCHLLMMMLLDAVMYMLICLYVEAIYPGTYGVPQPWDYFFRKEHWFSREEIMMMKGKPALPRIQGRKKNPGNFEKEPNLQAGVEIKHLWKIFGEKVAVRNLNLKMYEGQVTVLLGHNGAGKTTTMSIITEYVALVLDLEAMYTENFDSVFNNFTVTNLFI